MTKERPFCWCDYTTNTQPLASALLHELKFQEALAEENVRPAFRQSLAGRGRL